ncbi:GntR family transcriptional regulator [Palleronia aestuarii]|uniref:GntR family transcriptional regulator n=1 Tax=Palleronia aestuarii TaxID=568105 RepID=UPI001B86BCEE|nr:GntR family transcriptional regulator [Palleronia aestuarii]
MRATDVSEEARPFGPDTGGLEALRFDPGRGGSVADRVHGVLRAAIVEVRLAPGTPISENSICRQFSVSRTPVRAAIQRLSEEGLVDVSPQRGSFVAPLRIDGLRDSHFIRRSLELAILREVAGIWTEEMSAEMRAIIEDQARVIEAGNHDGFFEEDERFHHRLATFCGRDGVWEAIRGAKVTMTRFYRYWAHPERLAEVLREHGAVIDALDTGDAQEAERALSLHLDVVFNVFDRMSEEERRNLPA